MRLGSNMVKIALKPERHYWNVDYLILERRLDLLKFTCWYLAFIDGDLLVPFDFLVPLRNSEKDSRTLRNLLLTLKRHPDYILIYFSENPRFDYKVISGAMKDMRLDGVKFFLVARSNKIERFESIVKTSGADFVFISSTKKPDKYIEWGFMRCPNKTTRDPLKCPDLR